MGTAPPTATSPPKGRARPPTLPASGAERLLGAPRESETTRAAVPRSRRQAVGEYPVWACSPMLLALAAGSALVTSAAVAALLAILAGAVAHHCHCFEARSVASCAVDLDPLDARALHLLGRAYLEASQAPTSWRVAAWASSAPIPRPSVLDALGALLRAEHAWASLHSGAPWPANLLAQAQAHLAAGDRAAATNCLALCIDLGSAAHADAESAEAAAEAAALRRDEGLV
ncbi:hypothetical protein FNF28_05215 [Cafeteria roenbergensis]|uniref:Uncharacterized protein n=1 Tax=Cafeteria roenbergensis TaxID=33653 RepID=A0A5A8D7B4_CAFRO|nr:hypothetical protein FNF28_05215 [Cafeteria roenbergensis]